MVAFNTTEELNNYFENQAQILRCKQDFSEKQADLIAMNKKGRDGKPGCLCAIKYVPCPCIRAPEQIEKDGECHCEIFRRK